MFESLNRFFQRNIAETEASENEEHRLRVATCALLLEVAHADDEFSEEERQVVDRAVSRRFNLTPTESSELIALAEQERDQQHDIYQFARLVNDNYTRSRKLAVVELLWDVVFSDGVLAAHEDAVMHKLARLLGLRNQELVAVKTLVRKRLDATD